MIEILKEALNKIAIDLKMNIEAKMQNLREFWKQEI